MLPSLVRLSRTRKWKFITTSRGHYFNCLRILRTENSNSVNTSSSSGVTHTIPSAPMVDFNFSNTETIFKTKKTSEILRALVVLSVCSVDSLANNSEKLMLMGEKILGKNLFEWLMRKTFYGQFVAGLNKEEVLQVGERLKHAGIRTMLYIPIEADDPESTVMDYKTCEEKFDNNVETAISSVKTTERGEFTQMRITPFCSPQLLRTLTERLAPFKHKMEKPDNYTLNSFARGLDENFEGNILTDLDDESNEHLRRSLRRLNRLAESAESCGVRLMIDSEHTYLQAAINHVIMTIQFKYNRVKPIVFNTYQAYLKDTEGRVNTDLKLLKKSGVMFGAKLVRGAYLELERARAARLGYEDPIHPTAEATHRNYDNCVKRIMEDVASGHAHFMVATHNQTSILKALESLNEHNINPNDGIVTFAQTYGMCDQVSFALGAAGYPTYKSIPYGSIEDTLLYLTRRAKENKTVIAGSRKEKAILRRELWRRLAARQL